MKNTIPLQLHVPEPSARPGQAPDFSWLQIPEAGSVPRPDTDTEPQEMRPLAYSLIRVLDETGARSARGTRRSIRDAAARACAR